MPYNFFAISFYQIFICVFIPFFMRSTPTFALSQKQINALQNGSVAIFPTETIYGIGCSALCEKSLARVFEIKGRAPDQPPPVLIFDSAQLNFLVSEISPFAKHLISQHWPGALTLILPARQEISSLLCGFSPDANTRTVGVRCTAHPIARALCQTIGAPLIATSANASGARGREAAPQSLEDIAPAFKQQVDMIFDGGAVAGTPSTVVDCVSIPPRIVRLGAVPIEELE